MNSRLLSVALLTIVLVGCASPSPSPTEAPVIAKAHEVVRTAESIKVESGSPAIAITIGTHCGIGETPIDFDGSFWIPAGDLLERVAGLANPFDSGEIRLTGPDSAAYASNNGAVIDLVRVEPGPRVFALCR